MKRISIRLAALITAVMISMTAFAKTHEVGGKVVDTKGQPIEFVNVSLLSADSTYIQGAVSNENGQFLIKTTEERGILKLSCLGYQT